MLDNMNDQAKPNYSGYFIGTVVANNDPDMIERIKVSIPQLFQGHPNTLPWIGKKKAELFPDARDGSYGTFGLVPALGTQVIVSFQDSNPLYGMYEGTPHQTSERVAEAIENYLFRYGFKDPAGNLFMVDTLPNNVTILVQHVSGTLFRINNDGSIDLIAVKDITSSAPMWRHTGNLDITGSIDLKGGMTATEDVTASGISLLNHMHSGVKPGPANTGTPV